MIYPVTLFEIVKFVQNRYRSQVFRFRDVNNPVMDYLSVDPQTWSYDRHGYVLRVGAICLSTFFTYAATASGSNYKLLTKSNGYVLLSAPEELNVLRYMNDENILDIFKQTYGAIKPVFDLSHVP
jgi:hypothetical protein